MGLAAAAASGLFPGLKRTHSCYNLAMSLLQVWILIAGCFYLHHLVRWQMRRGQYAFAKLQKLVHSRSYDQVEVVAGSLSRHPHCGASMRAAALRCRAWGRICRGLLKEARDDVAQALEWNPRDGRAYLVKAMADWNTHPAEALLSLDRAYQYRDRWGRRAFEQTISKFRGLALSRLGRAEEALVHFAASPGGLDRVMEKYAARALALSGRYQESIDRFRAAGEDNPRMALGLFLLSAGRPEESLFWLNRAVEHQPAHYYLSEDEARSERPADYRLQPELTEFGRRHLVGRKSAGGGLAQRN